jgi:hypothetical protein
MHIDRLFHRYLRRTIDALGECVKNNISTLRKEHAMKSAFASLLVLAFSTPAFAQAPESPWRSPFTPAPALGGVSPLSAERNHKAMAQDQAAWATHRNAAGVARGERTPAGTERAAYLTSPKQLGRPALTSGR